MNTVLKSYFFSAAVFDAFYRNRNIVACREVNAWLENKSVSIAVVSCINIEVFSRGTLAAVIQRVGVSSFLAGHGNHDRITGT